MIRRWCKGSREKEIRVYVSSKQTLKFIKRWKQKENEQIKGYKYPDGAHSKRHVASGKESHLDPWQFKKVIDSCWGPVWPSHLFIHMQRHTNDSHRRTRHRLAFHTRQNRQKQTSSVVPWNTWPFVLIVEIMPFHLSSRVTSPIIHGEKQQKWQWVKGKAPPEEPTPRKCLNTVPITPKINKHTPFARGKTLTDNSTTTRFEYHSKNRYLEWL